MILKLLVPKKLDNFIEWILREILLRFSIFQSRGGNYTLSK